MASAPRGRKVRKRLCYTNEKLQNFLALIYIEDLEKAGFTFGDLLRYLDSLHIQCAVSPSTTGTISRLTMFGAGARNALTPRRAIWTWPISTMRPMSESPRSLMFISTSMLTPAALRWT